VDAFLDGVPKGDPAAIRKINSGREEKFFNRHLENPILLL